MKKSTPEDKERVKQLLKDDNHMFESMAPRDLYKLLSDAKADIMLSGGRTQFIALKAKMPWLDINQEREHPYAGYDGMVELVKRIALAIHNPIWEQVRTPAPWDAEGRLIGGSLSPLPAGGRSAPKAPGEGVPISRSVPLHPLAALATSPHRGEVNSLDAEAIEEPDVAFLAHHRKKFTDADASDMGEC